MAFGLDPHLAKHLKMWACSFTPSLFIPGDDEVPHEDQATAAAARPLPFAGFPASQICSPTVAGQVNFPLMHTFVQTAARDAFFVQSSQGRSAGCAHDRSIRRETEEECFGEDSHVTVHDPSFRDCENGAGWKVPWLHNAWSRPSVISHDCNSPGLRQEIHTQWRPAAFSRAVDSERLLVGFLGHGALAAPGRNIM